MTATLEHAQAAATEAAPQAAPQFVKRRMYHIFAPDGKALVVAMDGARHGPARGLHDPVKAVRHVVDGGADAILTTFGMARATAHVLRGRGLIIGLDGLTEDALAEAGVERALRFGADAVELKVFPDNPVDTKLTDLRRLAAACDAWGLPLLAEPIPVSFQDTAAHTIPNVAKAARIGAECGADFVKVHYVAPAEEYAAGVVAECYVPVLCLGGPAKEDPVDALRACYDALRAGARGIVFGRNIVTHERPDRMCAALGEIIHGGATVEQAARELRPPSVPSGFSRG
jgi:class I fructose-bisphosphate aldolase/fructose-bisphosphate aldolase/2-amino-3,7-dideoxy-D-threo-hept-6-ulosonate synthase